LEQKREGMFTPARFWAGNLHTKQCSETQTGEEAVAEDEAAYEEAD
jgi:hypothetical protein